MDKLYHTTQPSVLATAPYTRVPSPPPILVPPLAHPRLSSFPADDDWENNAIHQPYVNDNGRMAIEDYDHHPYANDNNNDGRMSISPSPNASHVTGLSRDELHLITTGATTSGSDLAGGTAVQTARGDGANAWVYEARRRAQRVLDYLYLGPAGAAKDRAFLAREGITMVLCARDPRFGGLMVNGVRRAVEGLGEEAPLQVEAVDVVFDGPARLMSAFAVVLERINAHVLAVNSRAAAGGGKRRGKVLVVCETGNDWSATMVVAYLMAMYGLDTVRAVQFVQLQRFCVTIGDDVKYVLQTYGDILRAKGQVGASPDGAMGGKSKRRMEMTSDENDEEMGGIHLMDEVKHERYAGRGFAPFVERDG